MRQLRNSRINPSGFLEPQFVEVRERFLANFERGIEVGAASPMLPTLARFATLTLGEAALSPAAIACIQDRS
jgi:hypothetical protein